MTSVFHAPDIECEHCADAIRQALAGLVGAAAIVVDVEACTIRVELGEGGVAESAIRAALEEAGYPTSP